MHTTLNERHTASPENYSTSTGTIRIHEQTSFSSTHQIWANQANPRRGGKKKTSRSKTGGRLKHAKTSLSTSWFSFGTARRKEFCIPSHFE